MDSQQKKDAGASGPEGVRRKKRKPASRTQRLLGTLGILILGIALGAFSKFLDETGSNRLPVLLQVLDLGNFLGRFAIWMLLALCIAVFSDTPAWAAARVFVFFVGMVSSYYLYSYFIAGFFPKHYALIWVGFTAASPFLAVICWYAAGDGKIALALSALILAVLFNVSFVYGWGYFQILSPLELLTFLCGGIVLRRRAWKDTILMLALGLGAALLLHLLVPFVV